MEYVEIIGHINGPTEPFQCKEKLSSKFGFFANQNELLLIADPRIDQLDADLGLAYGLAFLNGRTLSLVLPVGLEIPTKVRIPWFLAEVKLYVFGEGKVTLCEKLTEEKSIDFCVDTPRNKVKSTQVLMHPTWIENIVDWISKKPEVRRTDRPGYAAWHCEGRQILKVSSARNKLTIFAGVQSKEPDGYGESWILEITKVMDKSEEERIRYCIDEAIKRRIAGLDAGHEEHKLQSKLKPKTIGCINWRREYSCLRFGQSPGFIDFLGIDSAKRLHIVETKIGPDAMLVFQALDYWIWVRANMDVVGKDFSADSSKTPIINFVLKSAKAGADWISIYTAAHLESLKPEITWRFWLVDENIKDPLKIKSFADGEIPKPYRRAGVKDLPSH